MAGHDELGWPGPGWSSSIVEPHAQFLEWNHDVLAKWSALLQRAVPALDLR
jgi:hypothetical protein